MKGFMIAGTNSNSGKTTVTLGLMSALKKRGLVSQSFKTGPDYIDTAFHSYVTNSKSYNLDTFMLEDDIVRHLFYKHIKNCDAIVVEGVMGLYDGVGSKLGVGSSAYLAKMLNLPVILVIDGRGMSVSSAAIASGYKNFDTEINFAGIIFTRLSSDVHYKLMKECIENNTDIKCYGYIPENKNLTLNSRHLGLVQAMEVENVSKVINLAGELCEKHIDIDGLLKLNINTEKTDFINVYKNRFKGKKVAVAMDKAFSFYYEDNLMFLKELGFEITYISPLNDKKLPNDVDLLYLGGGYPEVYAKQLEENDSFKRDLLFSLLNGLPCYAECGGMMYLTKSIETLEGNAYTMVGFIEGKCQITKRLINFGYNRLYYGEDYIKTHEFHRSILKLDGELEHVFSVKHERTGKEWKSGIRKENVLCGYPHIHFYSNVDFVVSNILSLLLEGEK